MRRFSVFVFTILFILTMALPAMAQVTPNNSPVQRSSFDTATFYGGQGTTDTYVHLVDDYENQDQYILYVDKYNYETNASYYGKIKISKSDLVFDTNKGTVIVSKTVAINKVEWVYDEVNGVYNPIETYVVDESINLTWSFNPRDYSYHKSVDKKIKVGFNEYLQIGKSTLKEYNNVTVSGNIGDLKVEDFDYTGANVYTGTSLEVIK